RVAGSTVTTFGYPSLPTTATSRRGDGHAAAPIQPSPSLSEPRTRSDRRSTKLSTAPGPVSNASAAPLGDCATRYAPPPIGSDGSPIGRSDIGSTRVSETTLPFQTVARSGARFPETEPAASTRAVATAAASDLLTTQLHRTRPSGSGYVACASSRSFKRCWSCGTSLRA